MDDAKPEPTYPPTTAVAGREQRRRRGVAWGLGLGCGIPTAAFVALAVVALITLANFEGCSVDLGLDPPLERCALSSQAVVRLATAGPVEELRAEVRTADPNQADRRGNRALPCAAMVGNRPGVEALLDAGANPAVPGATGGLPIVAAVSGEGLGSSDTDTSYRVQDSDQSDAVTVEFKAPDSRERTKIVELLLAQGADPAPALRPATEQGNVGAVVTLLDAGADPDGSPDQPCPLTTAVYFDQQETVELLLARGADPDAGGRLEENRVRGPFGFEQVLRDGRPLPRPGSPPPSPTSAAAPGTTTPFTIRSGQTEAPPLAVAAFFGDGEMVTTLLVAGADPNRPAFGAYPPLDGALLARRLDLVNQLLAAGADPRPSGPGIVPPLEVARQVGFTEAVPILEQAPAPRPP